MSMKRDEGKPSDDMRPEYTRSDFGALVRGKYARLLRKRKASVRTPRGRRAD